MLSLAKRERDWRRGMENERHRSRPACGAMKAWEDQLSVVNSEVWLYLCCSSAFGFSCKLKLEVD